MSTPLKFRSRSSRCYELDEFAQSYDLPKEEAERLYKRFGPSATELDALMRAKRLAGSLTLSDAARLLERAGEAGRDAMGQYRSY
jgi:hypothetical protein